MKTMVYCKPTKQGIHSFYLVAGKEQYFLFSQNYRKGVQSFFAKGVLLDDTMKFEKTHNDNAIIRTMMKLPMYIRYVEKEYEIEVYEKTKKRNKQRRYKSVKCA